MGLLRKLLKPKAAPIKVRKVTNLYLHIDQLKQKDLLQTTDYGVFYVYTEVVALNKDPKPFLRNLYTYARTTGLLAKGKKLEIRDLEDPNDDFLIAEVQEERCQVHRFSRNTNKIEKANIL